MGGMGSIHKTNKLIKGKERELTQGGIQEGLGHRNMRQGRHGQRAPINDAPILGLAEILANLMQGNIMFAARGGGVSTKQCGDKPDIRPEKNIGVGKFTQNLTVRKTKLMLQGVMRSAGFQRARVQTQQAGGRFRGHRYQIMPIGLVSTRGTPTVRLKDACNVHFAIDLDVIASLVQIQAVVLDLKTTGTGSPDTITGGCNMCVD